MSTQRWIDELSDDQWARVEPFVPGGRRGRRGPRSDNRRFVNALIWMARSGARWRDLPERYGDYQTVKRRYYRWIENGVLDRLFEALAEEADLRMRELRLINMRKDKGRGMIGRLLRR